MPRAFRQCAGLQIEPVLQLSVVRIGEYICLGTRAGQSNDNNINDQRKVGNKIMTRDLITSTSMREGLGGILRLVTF